MSPETAAVTGALPWLTIAAMAAVTFVTRIAGYLALAGVPETGLMRRILDQVPGATFAALVAPRLLVGRPDEWLAAAVLAVLLMRSGAPAVALAGYVATLAGLRALLG